MQYPVGINPVPAAAVHEETVDLSSVLTNSAVSMGKVWVADTVYVKSLTGTATLKFNGTDADAISISAGESRQGLAVHNLYISTAGSAGWTVTLEFHGKPLNQMSFS